MSVCTCAEEMRGGEDLTTSCIHLTVFAFFFFFGFLSHFFFLIEFSVAAQEEIFGALFFFFFFPLLSIQFHSAES